MFMLQYNAQVISLAAFTLAALATVPASAGLLALEASSPMEDVAADIDRRRQLAACQKIARYRDSRPTLILVSDDKHGVSEQQANTAFDDQDKHAERGVSDLLHALRSDKSRARIHAAKALGRLGDEAEHAMPALIEAAGDNRWDVRAEAVWAIGKVASKGQVGDVVDFLTISLDDPSDRVRWSAAWSLARIGPAAEAAVPALLERLNDPSMKIRSSALSALTKVASRSSHDEIIHAVARLKDDKDELVRQRAASALTHS